MNAKQQQFEIIADMLESIAEEPECDDPDARRKLLNACAARMREAAQGMHTMNLNHILPIYSHIDRAIVLLDSRPGVVTFGRRIVHQQTLDAMVQFINNDGTDGAIQINSMGKNYVLRMALCK